MPPTVTEVASGCMEQRYFYDSVTVHQRRRLPHWHARSGLYLLTFRLADSLPAAVLERMKPDPAQRRIEIEEALDLGYGQAHLARPEAVNIVRGALEFFDRERYSLVCWTVMSNHVHVIFGLRGEHTIDSVVASWKRYTAREINELLGRRGRLWQEEYFETLIRSAQHLTTATEYVLANPAKAGLDPQLRTGFNSEAFHSLL
jgi:menaquinone-specific isochorismate synthase/putative DNA methylase